MQPKVQLFVTCLIDTFYPEIGQAVVDVLNRLGVIVEFPSHQTCCGQPAFNAGLWESARPMAEHTIKTFENTSGEIVIPSGSCTAMIRHGYQQLFSADPSWQGRAAKLGERVFEFSQYLVDVLGVQDTGARFEGKLAYHPSCHLLRGLGVDQQPRSLMQNVRQAELIPLPNAKECCGFGGVFSVEHPELSNAMLERKIEAILQCGSQTIVSCDTGCLMHINGGLQRRGLSPRVVHLAQVLNHT